MARFKLVRTGKKRGRVEVQKVHLKVHYGALLLAFVCAVLVWLYVKGSTPLPPTPPEDTTSEQTETANVAVHEPSVTFGEMLSLTSKQSREICDTYSDWRQADAF